MERTPRWWRISAMAVAAAVLAAGSAGSGMVPAAAATPGSVPVSDLPAATGYHSAGDEAPGTPPLRPQARGEGGGWDTVSGEAPLPEEPGQPGDDAQDTIEAQIVGGEPIAITAAPWQVALVRTAIPSNYIGQFCGGSVLNRYWVVTAAHCVVGFAPRDVKVLAGTATLSGDRAGRRAVSRIVIRSDYNRRTVANDLALLRLREPLSYSRSIQPIRIPDKRPAKGKSARITGWGSTWCSDSMGPWNCNGTQPLPVNLQRAQVTVQSDATCSRELGSVAFLRPEMLCARSPGWGRDTCQGDSGGPLATRQKGEWFLSGITSWGFGCASNSAGAYTNVANYASWIRSTIRLSPGAPRKVRATAGNGRVTLSWTRPASTGISSITGYSIQRRAGNGKWRDVTTRPAKARKFAVKGLSPGVTYRFRVVARNASGTGVPSKMVTARAR